MLLMGRPTNIDTRRAQVADALIGLLADRSFENVTIVDMAKASGVRPGLVHHYFGDKDEVLTVAVERLTLLLEMRLTERLRRAGDDPRARIDAFIDAWLALADGVEPRAARAWVAIGDEARKRPEIASSYGEAISRATGRLLQEVNRIIPARKRRSQVIAQAIVVAIEGALRVGAGGGLEARAAAPLVRGVAAAMLNDAAANP